MCGLTGSPMDVVKTLFKMAGVLKKATGLTGLKVARDPHKTLSILYDKILRTLQKVPEDSVYRTNTESIVKGRLDVVKSQPTIAGLEQKMNCGQAEELILQAERELSLARKMIQWKAWEPLIEQPPPNQWKWPI